MKRLMLAGVALLLAIADRASAQDILALAAARRSPSAFTAASWSGFYGGVSLGARWASNVWRSSDVAPTLGATIVQLGDTSGSMNNAAPRFGAYVGYNWRVAPQWLFGLEADFGWANNSSSANPAPGTNITWTGTLQLNPPIGIVRQSWDGSVRGRVGMFAASDLLIFATGGVALQGAEFSAYCPAFGGVDFWCVVNHNESYSKTLIGWTVGGGVERRIWGRWLARVDYRYADFGTIDQQFFSVGTGFDDRFTAHVRMSTHTATFGLAYKF